MATQVGRAHSWQNCQAIRRFLTGPMRVLFATNHSYPPQRVGGSESSTHDLCLTLLELGHSVGVLSSLLFWPPIGAIHRLRFAWRGRASFVRDEILGYPVFRARRPILAVHEVVHDFAPDVAVIQAGSPIRLAERFTASSLPCVVYLRDTMFGRLGGPVLEHPLVRYVATSRDLAGQFANAFGIVPLCIPPIVRPDRYGIEPLRKNVTFVCPRRQKGLEIALGLAARRPDIPFVFVESWPLRPKQRRALRRRIRQSGNITFRHRTLEMRDVYQDARLILVPTQLPLGEAWGRVVSEAQVSGIPVLASNLGGLPESVGGGGILVDPSAELSDWEAALARMWDDPTEYQRFSRFAMEHARRAGFQPIAIAEQLLGVLTDLVTASTGVFTSGPTSLRTAALRTPDDATV